MKCLILVLLPGQLAPFLEELVFLDKGLPIEPKQISSPMQKLEMKLKKYKQRNRGYPSEGPKGKKEK
jgi:hypothetical protein